MIEKIKPEELIIFETLRQPIAVAEILFHNFDDLGSFSENEYGHIRNYQYPFLSYVPLFLKDEKLSKKENFNIKKGLGDIYALGGRLTGKTLCVLIIDVLIALFHKTFNWGVISSFDALHLRGVIEKVINALDNHPILKLLKAHILRSPTYKINTKNGCLLESVNENLVGKNPGGQWYQKHVDLEYAEEASFITKAVSGKKHKAVSELGCVHRYSGMTTFTKNSPMGKIFDDLKNESKIINLPSYVNPNYDEETLEDDIKEFDGKNSTGFLVQVEGKVIESGDSVYDIQRIRETYKKNVSIKSFEISKDNFFRYQDILILERLKNADTVMVALDKGEGSAPTEIIILFKINDIWHYTINITNFKLAPDEDEEVIKYIIEQIKANIIAIDVTSGKSLFCNISKLYPENTIAVAFNEKIDIDFERDKKGQNKYDKQGNPIYKQEYITDWSVHCLMQIFYNKEIKCLMDYKLDSQFNGVIAMRSGMRTIYKYKTANHLYQAFQVFAIADWQTKFKNIKPVEKRKLPMGIFRNN